jgi:hypothetical protein
MTTRQNWNIPLATGQKEGSANNIFSIAADANLQMWGGDFQSGAAGGNYTVVTTYVITRKDGSTASHVLASYQDSVIDYGVTANVTVVRTLATAPDAVLAYVDIDI